MARPTLRMRTLSRTIALVLVLCAPLPGWTLAPALLGLIRQLAQQVATSMIKDALLSGLAGMGCKGIALSNALAGFDRRSLLGGGMRLPAALPTTDLPPEMLATIDALFELGFMPPAAQAEFKQCMVLLPETRPALGMGMGMLRPMIPQLRQARDELRALPPAEQDEVAAALAQEVRALPPDQREALLEHIDSGFFPPRVSQGVKAQLAGR